DAASTANLLQQLYLGTGGTTGGATGAGGAGLPGGLGGLGVAGGAGGAALPGVTGSTFGGAVGIPRPVMTINGISPEGAPLIDLRLTVDTRTNSLVVAGSQHDLDVIEALISRLDDAEVQPRQNTVYHLKNAAAADVATAMQTFIANSLSVLSTSQQLTAFQDMLQAVVIVPEPVTNTLLVSATPEYYGDILHLIAELDAAPP